MWCPKTCGSLLAALDVHPRVAMQILRHSKIAVTMEIYTEIPGLRPVTRCTSWATGWASNAADLLLHQDQKRPVPIPEPASELEPRYGIEP